VDLFKESDLLAIVNWAEIDASSDIWKGILNEVIPAYKSSGNQAIFFDLSDLSKRSNAEISQAVELIRVFSQTAKVILGLNQNEAKIIYNTICKKEESGDLQFLGASIFSQLRPAILVVHSTRQSFAFDELGTYHCNSFFVEDPKISTGAGDNFNAGFCAGLLLDAGTLQSLVLASAVSALYVTNGASPQLVDVINFLDDNK
jgi:sugar/nucleoside kinase (ribokinase family)